MSLRIDLITKRFGAWTVISGYWVNENKQTVWLCRCDCGVERIVVGQALRNGASRSCGCLKPSLTSAKGDYALLDYCALAIIILLAFGGSAFAAGRLGHLGVGIISMCDCTVVIPLSNRENKAENMLISPNIIVPKTSISNGIGANNSNVGNGTCIMARSNSSEPMNSIVGRFKGELAKGANHNGIFSDDRDGLAGILDSQNELRGIVRGWSSPSRDIRSFLFFDRRLAAFDSKPAHYNQTISEKNQPEVTELYVAKPRLRVFVCFYCAGGLIGCFGIYLFCTADPKSKFVPDITGVIVFSGGIGLALLGPFWWG